VRCAIAIVIAPLLVVGCADATDAAEVPSVLPHVETLRPLIDCLSEKVEETDETEEWSGGVPYGPAQNRETVAACQAESEVSFQLASNQESVDFADPEVTKQLVFTSALLAFGDHRDHLTVEDFDEAMAIALCFQEEEIVRGEFFRKSKAEAYRIEANAMRKCLPDLALIEEDPAAPSSYNRSSFLGDIIASANRRYVEAVLGRRSHD